MNNIYPVRNGKPCLFSGNARPWQWTHYDAQDRLILQLNQHNEYIIPDALYTGTVWTHVSLPASHECAVTQYSYDSLSNDSADSVDSDNPRTVSRHLLRNGSATLIARTWHIYTRQNNTITHQTIRAASQTSTFGFPLSESLLTSYVASYDSSENLLFITTNTGSISRTESNTYDPWNRVLSHTDALGNTTHFSYDVLGNLTSRSGDTYPIELSYTSQGHLFSLSTQGASASPWNTTVWPTDPNTGIVIGKTYPDLSTTVSSHSPDKKHIGDSWARGEYRQFLYDDQKRIVTNVYSSSHTPSVARTYTTDNLPCTLFDASGLSYQYAYNLRQTLTNEILSVASMTFNLSRSVDSLERPKTTLVSFEQAPYASNTRTFDTENRLSEMFLTNAFGRACSISYAYDGTYLTNSTILLPQGTSLHRTWARNPHQRSIVQQQSVSYQDSPIYWNITQYDIVGRITNVSDSLYSPRSYHYNCKSELTSATIGNHTMQYSYDDIGNRTGMSFNNETTHYFPYNLNQYIFIDDTYLHCDADGNLLTDQQYTYAWDCENRLLSITPNNVLPGATRVINRYDPLHRRIQKCVEIYTTEWIPLRTHTFVYDEWNLLLEIVENHFDQTRSIHEYFWGPDLSGAEQDAGGVGGLLAVSINGVYYFPCYDQSGNITAYANEQGSLVASYVYEPYGKIISSSGPLSNLFSHRFSTKYFDPESDLYYYGYRFYSPSLGRWLSRDPLGEKGGLNLFQFCRNNPVNTVDKFGLSTFYLYLVGDSLTHAYDGYRDEIKQITLDFYGFKSRLISTLRSKYKNHTFIEGGVGAPGDSMGDITQKFDSGNSSVPAHCTGVIITYLAGINSLNHNKNTSQMDTIVKDVFDGWLSTRDRIISKTGVGYPRLFLAMTLPSMYESSKPDRWKRNYEISKMNEYILSSSVDNSDSLLTYKVVQLGKTEQTSYTGSNGTTIFYTLYNVAGHLKDDLHFNGTGNNVIVNSLMKEIHPWITNPQRFNP